MFTHFSDNNAHMASTTATDKGYRAVMDDKLKEILLREMPVYAHKNIDMAVDEAIAQIKQVFAEEGYVLSKQLLNIIERSTKQVIREEASNLMTGAEWYERFERELEYKDLTVRQSNKVLEAAKKASSLLHISHSVSTVCCSRTAHMASTTATDKGYRLMIKVSITNGGCSPISPNIHCHLEDVVFDKNGKMISAVLIVEEL